VERRTKLHGLPPKRAQPASVPILKSCAFHPNALVLRRREAASKDAPVRVGPGAAFWSILRDARLRLAPQDEGVGSPRQSTFTVNRTNFESGTLGRRALSRNLAPFASRVKLPVGRLGADRQSTWRWPEPNPRLQLRRRSAQSSMILPVDSSLRWNTQIAAVQLSQFEARPTLRLART
jgi:hypothetical protein